MWIKFNFLNSDAYGKQSTVKFAIEVEKPERALVVSDYFSNNANVDDVKVMISRPVDMYTIYISKEGCIESNSHHLVTNSSIQSFIWAIRAGISMGKALMEK